MNWDFDGNSESILFDPDGAYPHTSPSNYGEHVVRYYDGYVYFNQGKSLLSIKNDGNNLKILSSSIDEYNITGIIIID